MGVENRRIYKFVDIIQKGYFTLKKVICQNFCQAGIKVGEVPLFYTSMFNTSSVRIFSHFSQLINKRKVLNFFNTYIQICVDKVLRSYKHFYRNSQEKAQNFESLFDKSGLVVFYTYTDVNLFHC